MKTAIVGFLVFLSVVVGTILHCDESGNFIDLCGIGVVIIVAGGLALMRYRKGDTKLEIAENLKRYAIPAGLIACLIGLVNTGVHTIDPKTLSVSIAASILPVLYGLILYCILDTFTKRVRG